MRSKLRSALALTPEEWSIFGQAWCFLLGVDIGLRLASFSRLQVWSGRVTSLARSQSVAEVIPLAEHLNDLVELAARNHLYPMSCLRRALVLQRMLSRRGIPTQLRIGARKEPSGLAAHAWLEFAGQPVGEPDDVTAHFVPLQSPK